MSERKCEPWTPWPKEAHEQLLEALRVVDQLRHQGELTPELLASARARPLPEPAVRAHLVWLADRASPKEPAATRRAFPGRRALEGELGLSERGVRRALRDPRWQETCVACSVPLPERALRGEASPLLPRDRPRPERANAEQRNETSPSASPSASTRALDRSYDPTIEDPPQPPRKRGDSTEPDERVRAAAGRTVELLTAVWRLERDRLDGEVDAYRRALKPLTARWLAETKLDPRTGRVTWPAPTGIRAHHVAKGMQHAVRELWPIRLAELEATERDERSLDEPTNPSRTERPPQSPEYHPVRTVATGSTPAIAEQPNTASSREPEADTEPARAIDLGTLRRRREEQLERMTDRMLDEPEHLDDDRRWLELFSDAAPDRVRQALTRARDRGAPGTSRTGGT